MVKKSKDSMQKFAIESKHYVTPKGLASLKSELKELASIERPKIVKVVSWAAGNGDRSENGDYIYGKRRLREIDWRVRYLIKRIENAQVVEPAMQQNNHRIFFGATVDYYHQDGTLNTIKIVGIDEADINQQTVSYNSPIAKALLKSQVGDEVLLQTPQGLVTLEVMSIKYI